MTVIACQASHQYHHRHPTATHLLARDLVILHQLLLLQRLARAGVDVTALRLHGRRLPSGQVLAEDVLRRRFLGGIVVVVQVDPEVDTRAQRERQPGIGPLFGHAPGYDLDVFGQRAIG